MIRFAIEMVGLKMAVLQSDLLSARPARAPQKSVDNLDICAVEPFANQPANKIPNRLWRAWTALRADRSMAASGSRQLFKLNRCISTDNSVSELVLKFAGVLQPIVNAEAAQLARECQALLHHRARRR
jgi:hypothetical protein